MGKPQVVSPKAGFSEMSIMLGAKSTFLEFKF